MTTLKKFYTSKRFEEFLGIVGLLYFVILIALAVWLVQFLISVTHASFVPIPPRSSSIVQFAIDKAKALAAPLQ